MDRKITLTIQTSDDGKHCHRKCRWLEVYSSRQVECDLFREGLATRDGERVRDPRCVEAEVSGG